MFSNNDSNMIKILNGEKNVYEWYLEFILFLWIKLEIETINFSIFKFRIRTEIENYMWNIGHKFSESLQ